MYPNCSQHTFLRLELLDILFHSQILHPNANLVTWASFNHSSANFESFSYLNYFKFRITTCFKNPVKFKLEKSFDIAICLKMFQQAIDNMDEN
jgi:hypothetical protein